jgi:hypothetical protein
VIAVRLTPKLLELIQRIAAVVDGIREVERPQTLVTGSIDVDGRALAVHVCTWIGAPASGKPDIRRLGSCLAAPHTGLQASGQDFSDRLLSFEWAELPAPGGTGQELPPGISSRPAAGSCLSISTR